jgi:hypothetical protein
MDQPGTRRFLIGLYHETGDQAFLRAASVLDRGSSLLDKADAWRIVNQPEERQRGRPRESCSEAALGRMALMIVRAEAKTPHAAAQIEARRISEHSREATVKRLLRAYKEQHIELESLAKSLVQLEQVGDSLAQISRAAGSMAEISRYCDSVYATWTKIARI